MFHSLLHSSVLAFKAATPAYIFNKHRQAEHQLIKYIFQSNPIQPPTLRTIRTTLRTYQHTQHYGQNQLQTHQGRQHSDQI